MNKTAMLLTSITLGALQAPLMANGAVTKPEIALDVKSKLKSDIIENARCFEFSIDSPARESLPEQVEKAIGCYIDINTNQELAFVKDKEGADLLTTALTTKIGQKLKLQHFSMSAGEVSMIEQSEYRLNPLPIPATLEEALHSEQNRGEIISLRFEAKIKFQMASILNRYSPAHWEKNNDVIQISNNLDDNGKRIYDEEVYLPDEKQPTDGYWWPHIGNPLARDEYSPLAKYDAYVESVAGYNPNTVGWELANHNSNVDWAGHCNGWVSSSILHGYDGVNLKDEANGTIITASDLQGLRSVESYCTRNAFYGRRYRNSRSDLNDIYPTEFHRVLTYYIKDLQKPVAYDFRNREAVDNHIISGYKFKFYETDEERKWLVQADLRAHSYSYDDYVRVRRVAPVYTRTYWYYLWESRNGRFYKGEWVNSEDHPDFMWVPLSERRCGRENPRLRSNWIEHMLNNLEQVPLDEVSSSSDEMR